MVGRHLDEDDRQAIGIVQPHLDQTPGLESRRPVDGYAGIRQPPVLGLDVTYL